MYVLKDNCIVSLVLLHLVSCLYLFLMEHWSRMLFCWITPGKHIFDIFCWVYSKLICANNDLFYYVPFNFHWTSKMGNALIIQTIIMSHEENERYTLDDHNYFWAWDDHNYERQYSELRCLHTKLHKKLLWMVLNFMSIQASDKGVSWWKNLWDCKAEASTRRRNSSFWSRVGQ